MSLLRWIDKGSSSWEPLFQDTCWMILFQNIRLNPGAKALAGYGSELWCFEYLSGNGCSSPKSEYRFCQKWIGSREIWRYLPFKMGVFLQVTPTWFSGPMFNPKTFNSLLRPIPFWYSRHGSSSGATWRFRHVSTHPACAKMTGMVQFLKGLWLWKSLGRWILMVNLADGWKVLQWTAVRLGWRTWSKGLYPTWMWEKTLEWLCFCLGKSGWNPSVSEPNFSHDVCLFCMLKFPKNSLNCF